MKTKLAGMGGAPAQTFVDDVFSTYLYTGNGSTQTITNGIDLAGKGGLVWIKSRNNSTNHKLIDSAQAASSTNWNDALVSNSTASAIYPATGIITAQTTGFQITSPDNGFINENTYTYASWTFRKAAKFFDVVTYTGNGAGVTKIIPHSLGVSPGMILVKKTSAAQDWYVWHKNTTQPHNKYLVLNTTAAEQNYDNMWGPNGYVPTSTEFNVSGYANDSGATYVAYLFAHDTSSTGIIQCGAVTLDGTATYQNVNLGWEAQFVLTKNTTTAANWFINDNMRGMPVDSNSNLLFPNTTGVEASSNVTRPTSTGFSINNLLGGTYIYMAIRRPNKPPTSGTQVYNANTAGTAEANTAKVGFYSGFPVDMVIYRENKTNAANDTKLYDRLRGSGRDIRTNTTGTEGASTFPLDASLGVWNTALATDINKLAWMFKRAPGFMDVVCYTGTGVARTVAHNLGVAPELMIVKKRSASGAWYVGVSSIGWTQGVALNDAARSGVAWSGGVFNNTSPTNLVFSLGVDTTNDSGSTYVAYLFATLAGISKVGSYTGNGTTQTINCGFAAGARFFLVKATSTTGSWWLWDSARGITAGNDPALQLNSTAAEITTADAVDPYSPGITVNQEATCSINASGVSYVYLAIS